MFVFWAYLSDFEVGREIKGENAEISFGEDGGIMIKIKKTPNHATVVVVSGEEGGNPPIRCLTE